MKIYTILGILDKNGITYNIYKYEVKETPYYYNSIESSHRFKKANLLKPASKSMNTIPSTNTGLLSYRITCFYGHINEAKSILLKTFSIRLLAIQEEYSNLQEGILKEINKIKIN